MLWGVEARSAPPPRPLPIAPTSFLSSPDANPISKEKQLLKTGHKIRATSSDKLRWYPRQRTIKKSDCLTLTMESKGRRPSF